jgi:hypothetical protein
MSGDEWDSLDIAARVNLAGHGQSLEEFYAYKARLRAGGEPWGSAEQILRGFIWDRLEEPESERDDES